MFCVSISLLISMGYTLFVQYVFMFQWPKLPELWFSVRGYKSLEDLFCGQSMVRASAWPYRVVWCIGNHVFAKCLFLRACRRTRETSLRRQWRHTSMSSPSLGLWPHPSTTTAACSIKRERKEVPPRRWVKCLHLLFGYGVWQPVEVVKLDTQFHLCWFAGWWW